jgi:hypothetical protein
MKSIFLLCFLSVFYTQNWVFSQNKIVPLHSFYKDNFLRLSGKKSIETFFPANEKQLHLSHLNRDSSKQYYELTDWLFKRDFVRIENDLGSLSFNPLIDINIGREKNATSRLFRNTRGIFVEGQLLDKLGFSFIFAENQARFMSYESEYFLDRGEIWIINNQYHLQNATISGGSRTKFFKGDAFDYSYSIGNIHYQLTPKIRIEVGNSQNFVGVGYRSLFLSDNASVSPSIRTSWEINSKWSYQFLFKKNYNQYRKPMNVDDPHFEFKTFGATYLTYKPTENISISLFTGGNQLRADSLIKNNLEAQMLVPLPFFQNDLLFGNTSLINGITGLNFDLGLEKMRLYGQVAVDKLDSDILIGSQAGMYLFQLFESNLMFQAEWNYVPNRFYSNSNPKLAYSQFNLPSAHPKGNNFTELFARLTYEYNRFFISSKSIYYSTFGGDNLAQIEQNSIFRQPNTSTPSYQGFTYLQEIEFGIRLNRKYNAMILAGWKGRATNFGNEKSVQHAIWFGLRTGIVNQYFDF